MDESFKESDFKNTLAAWFLIVTTCWWFPLYVLLPWGAPKNVKLALKFESMAVEVSEEYLVYDFANFIGTLGGSLGLFIGFSYTGFIGGIIDYFFVKFQTE